MGEPEKTVRAIKQSKMLRNEGRLDEAEALIGNLLKEYPDTPKFLNEYGQIGFIQKQFDLAGQRFLQAHRLDPLDPFATNNLGKLHLRLGNLKQAETWYRTTLTSHPDDVYAMCGLGIVARRKRNPDEAQGWFQQVLLVRPKDRVALKELQLLAIERRIQEALADAAKSRKDGRLEEATDKLLFVLGSAASNAELLNELASVAFCRRAYAEAEKWYRRTLHFHPGNSEAQWGLERVRSLRRVLAAARNSKALRKQGRADEAEEELRKVLADLPTNDLILNELGSVHLEKGAWEQASACFNETLRHHPGDVVAQVNLARLAGKQGLDSEARCWLKQALAGAPDNSYAMNLMGDLERTGGNLGAAEYWYQKCLKSHPSQIQALTGMGLLSLQNRRFNRARRYFEAVLESAPRDPVAHAGLSRIRGFSETLPMVSQAKRMRKQRDFDAAEKLLLKGLQKHPDHPNLLIELGLVAYCTHQYDKAATVFGMAYQHEPGNVVVLNLLGSLELKAMREGARSYTRAAKWFRKALEQKPTDENALNNLGWVYLRQNRLSRAARHFRDVLDVVPGNAKAMEGMGEIALRLGQLEKAKQWWEQAWWDQRRENPVLMTNMAKVSIAEGDLAAARTYLEDALLVAPRDAYAMTSLAYLCILEESYGEADSLLDKASRKLPNDERILNLKGKLAQKRGDFKAAQRWFETTLEHYPENTYALVGLGWTDYECKRFEQAGVWFDEALKHDPGNAHALTGLGVTRARLGEYDGAEECYRSTLQTRFHPPALWHWFRATILSGNTQRFTWFLRQALEVGRFEERVGQELREWDKRMARLVVLQRDGLDPWPFVHEVGVQLSPIYSASDSPV